MHLASTIEVAEQLHYDPEYTFISPSEADKRLIEAAPELLQELIILRNDLARQAAELRQSVTIPGTETILEEEDETLCEFEESRIARLDALIAKAKGEA